MEGQFSRKLLTCSSAVLLLATTFTVAQEPTLTLEPTALDKSVGENVYVSCTANVPDKDLVEEMEWINPQGQKISRMDDGSRVKTTSFSGKGSLELLIEKLVEADSGTYKCQVTYAGNNKLEQEIKIEVFKDIDFRETPTFQTPKIHTDAKIKCDVTASPPPEVDWLKDGVAITSDSRMIVQSDGILIKNIDEDAEGIYRCRARLSKFGVMKFIDIQVEVHTPPTITGPPEDVVGVEKEAANFQCVATGKPTPKYSWVDKESRKLQDLEGYHVNDVTGQLTIMDVRPGQAGEYICTATNPAGDDQASANLRVLTKPKIETYLNITADEGASAELRCIATGDPLPDIIFKKESNADPFTSGSNDDDRIVVSQIEKAGKREGILHINEVMRKDDGLYSCNAESDGGNSVGWGHITAQFKPSFEDQLVTEFWSWEKEKVNLSCIATSIPNATIQWYFANKQISRNDQNLKVLALGPTGVLQVDPNSPSYFGTYTCEASNLLGKNTIDFVLKQAHKPGPISNSQIKKKTATTIEWGIIEPVDNGGRPVLGFLVEYKQKDLSWTEAENTFWTKGGQYVVDKLTPLGSYTFRFAARNEVGDGDFGGQKSVEMPKESYPEEPLIYSLQPGIVNPSPYSSHFELMWKVPLDNGSPISAFEITYYKVVEKEHKWTVKGKKNTETVEYPGDTKFKIVDLHSETTYKIEVRARNSLGDSRPAEAIIQTARGSDSPDIKSGGLGAGIIIAIVIISILIIAGLIDVSCFFAKNIGVTATIVGKVGDSQLAKDKEAMLEDGVNTSEKPEGNGNMKSDEEKVPLTQDEEKPKETTEPTETTPMIQEGKPTDKDAIISEEKQTLEEGGGNVNEAEEKNKDSPV